MMETTLFWLLLPIAALSGWYIRGRSDNHIDRMDQFSTNYFRGLNYLLNEEQDKAIEVFLKIAEVDSNTVETHLALGNLFRRRGEVDRAIRFHQNLVAREELNPEQRTQAILELGEDFMRAGLLDRAEKLFAQLVHKEGYSPSALEHLVSIYQQERDWLKCIEHAEKLHRMTRKDMCPVIAQFYCEMAESAVEDKQIETAKGHLKRALKTDPACVRASLIEGDIAFKQADYKAAAKAYLRVEQQDLDYIPEVLERLLNTFAAEGSPDAADQFLRRVVDRYQGISPVLALASRIEKQQGRRAAARFMGEQLRIRPSVRGLEYLIGLNMSDSEGQARNDLIILRELTSKLLAGKPVYRCNQCGFGARSHHWQCPSCKYWNSVKPIHGVSAE